MSVMLQRTSMSKPWNRRGTCLHGPYEKHITIEGMDKTVAMVTELVNYTQKKKLKRLETCGYLKDWRFS